MSEYQYIAFRAIDAPVSDNDLEYMRRQSSRAEITPWSFDNEYHYGDFRGDPVEMMRRGYDLHLHYANFGVRKLLVRLPGGPPDSKAAKPYLTGDSLGFRRDKDGLGGTLFIQPFYEPGDLEEFWEFDDLLDRFVSLRAEILDGDLRPLYLAHLAVSSDDNHDPEETKEAPVPAGLDRLSDAQRAMSEFFGLGQSLIAAAALESPPPPARNDPRNQHLEWLRQQPATIKDEWLAQWIADPRAGARREMLARFRECQDAPLWPVSRADRTIAELHSKAEEIQREENQKAAARAARQRAKRLAEMKADPSQALRDTEKLVAQRSTEAYREIAMLLADLREALAGSHESGLAEQQAQKLKSRNPTLRLLTAELRRAGFLPK